MLNIQPNIPTRMRRTGLDLLFDFVALGFLVAGLRLAAGLEVVFFLAKRNPNFGSLKSERFTPAFFLRGFTAFFWAVCLTVFLFFDNFTAEYRRSATKRPLFLPELLISHPIWCLPVFGQLTGFTPECRGLLQQY